MFNMPSAQQLDEQGGDYTPLPEDEYLAEVAEVAIDKDNVNPFTGEKRDQLKVKFKIISFADNSELVDVEGNALEQFTLTAFIDPTKVGMKPQPSRARKFFTSVLGVPLGSAISISGPEELLGKRVIIGTVNKPGKEAGTLYTRAQDYKPIKKLRPERKPAPLVQPTEDDEGEEVQF